VRIAAQPSSAAQQPPVKEVNKWHLPFVRYLVTGSPSSLLRYSAPRYTGKNIPPFTQSWFFSKYYYHLRQILRKSPDAFSLNVLCWYRAGACAKYVRVVCEVICRTVFWMLNWRHRASWANIFLSVIVWRPTSTSTVDSTECYHDQMLSAKRLQVSNFAGRRSLEWADGATSSMNSHVQCLTGQWNRRVNETNSFTLLDSVPTAWEKITGHLTVVLQYRHALD
jgi:hypothetical protein